MKRNNRVQTIQHITEQFLNEFNRLSEEELNWKPAKHKWSIAQVMEHIIAVNESYFLIFDQLEAGTYRKPLMAKIPFLPTFFGNLILKYVQPDRKKKTRTLKIWEPSHSRIDPLVMDRFRTHQMELMQRIASLEKLSDKNIIIGSPANKNIVYTLNRVFDIITVHEERHLNQAKEVWLLKTS